jgi:hypothetical protein
MTTAFRSNPTLSLLCALAAAGTAEAQYTSNFEAVNASAAGTVLTGQDAYYVPPATTSVDFNAHTYAGNAYGIAANPTGGSQFIAGNGPGTGTFARAQRDITFGTGVWTVGFDVCAVFAGTLPTAQNAGSFSLQPSTTNQNFIALARWVDVNLATEWNADYVWYDSAGTALTENVGDPGFLNLPVNTWYRWETDFNLSTNEITEVRLTNIATGVTVTNNPIGRYLFGGTTLTPAPTSFRFFAGGGNAGNVMAFDNCSIGPAGPVSIGTRYCSPAPANSTGMGGRLSVTGSNVAATNDVTLNASSLPNNAFGFFITSPSQGMVVMPGGSQGTLCLSGGIGRYVGPGQIQNSGGTGSFSYHVNLNQHPTPNGFVVVQAGQTWNFQCWHRDAVGGVPTSNFTDAVSVVFQ